MTVLDRCKNMSLQTNCNCHVDGKIHQSLCQFLEDGYCVANIDVCMRANTWSRVSIRLAAEATGNFLPAIAFSMDGFFFGPKPGVFEECFMSSSPVF